MPWTYSLECTRLFWERGPVMDYLGQTGLDALKGADILKTAPSLYHSSVEYANTPISQNLQGISKVLCAGLGTRNFLHATYRLRHPRQSRTHPARFARRSSSGFVGFSPRFAGSTTYPITCSCSFLPSSAGGPRTTARGTDHGAGGLAFAMGDRVKGGIYGEYPSLGAEDLVEGDLCFNTDFRGCVRHFSRTVARIGCRADRRRPFRATRFRIGRPGIKKAVGQSTDFRR